MTHTPTRKRRARDRREQEAMLLGFVELHATTQAVAAELHVLEQTARGLVWPR